MAGKVKRTIAAAGAAAAVSTGGSLIGDAKLRQLYATMVQCRLLTERARLLHHERRFAGLYEASMGQEAIATGCAIDLQPEDTIAPAPRDLIAGLVKGVPLDAIVAQLYARCAGPDQPSAARNIIPPVLAPEAQLSAATGVALAHKLRKNGNVVVAFTREAVTALGCWHEALDFAALLNLPIIFVVENNPWADPAGLKAGNEVDGFTLKARSYGLPGITVDGNDVVAVYRVAYESLARVRQGGGPVLVEGKTYRPYGLDRVTPRRHHGAKDDHRSTEDLGGWRSARDPLTHMERYLTARKLFTEEWKNQLTQEFSRALDAAVEAAEKTSARLASGQRSARNEAP